MTTSRHPESGLLRPSSRAVEPPISIDAAAPRSGRGRKLGGVILAGLAVLGLGATLVAKQVGADDSLPGPRASAPVVTGAAPGAADPTPLEDRALQGGIGPASAVAVSPSGERVLAVRDRGVDVWKLDGARLAWLAVDGDRVAGAAWARDGRRVVIWGPEGTVRLWNVETGAMIQTIQAGMGFVTRAEMPDDDHVLTIGIDGVRRLWDLRSGDVRVQRGVNDAANQSTPVRVDALTPDGRWRAFVDPRGEIRLQRML